jgi:hypothetical protein
MTTRIVVVVALAFTLACAHAADLNKLPPMHYKMRADVELKGREVEAIEVALRQFRDNHYSTSGDLKHFTVELRRESGNKLAVSFFPELHEPSQHALPARNKYGTYITYFVSLRTLKIVGFTWERD